MTPAQKIKQLLLSKVLNQTITENIDDLYKSIEDEDLDSNLLNKLYDEVEILRSGSYDSEIEVDNPHLYLESKSVAAKMLDGSYVGWTYWYGGGKHSYPEEIHWIEDAYDVEMLEIVMIKKVFKKC